MDKVRTRVKGFARSLLETAGHDHPALLPDEAALLRALVNSTEEAEVDAAFAATVTTAWFPLEYFELMFRSLTYCSSTAGALRVCDLMLEGVAESFMLTTHRLHGIHLLVWDTVIDMLGIFRRVTVARRIMESSVVFDMEHTHRWLSSSNTPFRFGKALQTCLTTPSRGAAEQMERVEFVQWLHGAVVFEDLVASTPCLPELLQAFQTSGPLGLHAEECAAFIALHRRRRRWSCALC